MLERPHKSTTHDELFFHFIEPMDRYKGATVFCRQEDDGLWYGEVAFCAPTDQFSRRIGRSQARRKYFQNFDTYAVVYLGQHRPTYDRIRNQLLRDLAHANQS